MEQGMYNANYNAHANNPFAAPDVDEEDFSDVHGGGAQRGNNANPFLPNYNNQNNLADVHMCSSACQRAAYLGSSLLVQGDKFLRDNNLIGEGPKPLRAFCFLGGFLLVLASVLSLLNIFAFLSGPSTYVLQLYLVILGVITMIVEAKDMRHLERFKPFIYEWLKFLTVPGGKGIFYFFIGSISVSLWSSSFLSLIAGLYVCTFGLVCILVHMGLRNQVANAGIALEEPPTVVTAD